MNGRTWTFGDSINTDQMVAGIHMKLPLEQQARHCLKTVRPEFVDEARQGDILVAGNDFGIGSSREQAPQALKALGIKAIIARSFGGIFYRNALNLGLIALVCEDSNTIPDNVLLEFDAINGQIKLPAQGVTLSCEPLPAFLLDLVNDGGLLPHLKKKLADKTTL